jgi:hypothetical protein
MIARIALVWSLGLALAACSMLGRETEFSKSITTSGVGPFRLLTGRETGLPDSRVLDAADALVRRGSAAGDVLYVDVETELGRSIQKATRIGICRGFQGLTVALEASEPWEGASVREPYALLRDDGSIRVYYAADGGIGLAEAASPAAPLVKSPENPILAGELSGPAVVEDPELGILMYFAEAGRIFAARSEDGVSFVRLDADERTPEMDPLFPLLPSIPVGEDGGVDESEIAHALPGAIVGAMPSGRRTVRLYFTSVRANGESFVAMGGSLDGVVFERAESVVLSNDDASAPVPSLDETGELTHLLVVLTGETNARLHEALSPLDVRLPGHPDVDTSSCRDL